MYTDTGTTIHAVLQKPDFNPGFKSWRSGCRRQTNGHSSVAMSKASSIDRSEKGCHEISALFLPMAAKELGAFAAAVNQLYGNEQARQSIDDWIHEFEATDWPQGAIPNWRCVTIAAATQLVSRSEIFTSAPDRR